MGDYAIRTMARSEIDLAIEWAAREGWNPGLHDADCYFAADPKGFSRPGGRSSLSPG